MTKTNFTLIAGLLTLGFNSTAIAAGADDPLLGKFMLDKFETTDAEGSAPLSWEADAWLGKDLNKLWIKSQGERINGETEQSNELLYSRAIAPFWDMQLGYREDRAGSESRDFLSIGVQGLAPYLFDTSSSLVFGKDNQIGLTAQFEYEFMLTQKLVLSPEAEMDFWSQNDAAMGVGSGLSTLELGLRLRYEIRREFAPYIGVSWSKAYGNTADYMTDEGEDTSETLFVAGVRIWF